MANNTQQDEAAGSGAIDDPVDKCQRMLETAEGIIELAILCRAKLSKLRSRESLAAWLDLPLQLLWAKCYVRAMKAGCYGDIDENILARVVTMAKDSLQVFMRDVSDEKRREWLQAPFQDALWSGKVGVVTALLESRLRGCESAHLNLAIKGAGLKGTGDDPELVVALLQRGAKAFVDTLSYDEIPSGGSWDQPDVRTAQSPLHLAAFYGFERIAQALVEAGASIDLLDGDGCTPLSLAIAQGRHSVACLLLARGARPNTVDRWGFPLLHRAVKCRESSSLVKLLLESGADVLARETDDGRTPLHEAIYGGDDTEKVLGILLAAGADLNGRDAHGNTPLMLACLDNNKTERVRYLLDQGADDMLANVDGRFPVDMFKQSLAEGDGNRYPSLCPMVVSDTTKHMLATLAERRKWRARLWLVEWRNRQSRARITPSCDCTTPSARIGDIAGLLEELPEEGLFKEIVRCL